MDDLDLEKLKKELHDVSGSSLYDVDQIMEEAGSSESGSRASMEQLLQSLGVQTQEQQERDTLDSLQQASEQTQAMIEEQQEMQQWLKPDEDKEAEQPDEDDVFGSLFAQLGELEREETPTDPRLTEPLLEPEEVPDDALIVPIAMMGAPTVLAEKAIGGTEYQKLFDMVSKFFGQKIYAFMPIEAGGVNSMLPIAAAARLGMPMVDVDGMGRAFPELQMVTFTIGGMKATPMALVDEKGNSCIFETITNKWTEELARAVTMSCGASVSVSLYPMSGRQMKEFGVHGIVTRSQQLGRAIRTIKDCGDKTPEEHFLEMAEGFKLFKGKIADVLRETRAGFNFGKVVLEGIGDYKGRSAYVEFQNENLTATVDGEILATTPDLISLVDTETFLPVTTDALKYGKRVMVVGLKCFHLWRTEKGIELVGPRYFGVDTDYIPLEERCKGGH